MQKLIFLTFLLGLFSPIIAVEQREPKADEVSTMADATVADGTVADMTTMMDNGTDIATTMPSNVTEEWITEGTNSTDASTDAWTDSGNSTDSETDSCGKVSLSSILVFFIALFYTQN